MSHRASSNLVSLINAKGDQRTYTYDAANRRTQEQHFASAALNTSSTTAARTISYTFDERGLLTGYTDSGEQGQAEANAATYTYDAKAQKIQETTTLQIAGTVNNSNPLTTPGANISKTQQISYYPNGLKKSFTYPANAANAANATNANTTGDGAQLSYTYDANGQLKTITLPNSRIISLDSYRWVAPTQKSMPGAVTRMDYDALLRPTQISTRALNAVNPNGSVIANSPLGTASTPQGATYLDYRYQFNDVANITQRQTEHGTYQYGYDDLDRLIQAVPPPLTNIANNTITALPIEAYTYDAVHNRKTSSHQTGNQANAWQYNADNQLTQWGDASGTNPAQPRVTQTYDANGHLLTKTVTPEDRNQAATTSQRYTYNIAERLIQVTDRNQAEIARYSYDPFGRRIRKTVSQTNSQSSGQGTPLGTTTYLYADEGLLAEADMSGNITTTYGWIPNGIWGTAPQWKADVTLGSGGTAALTYHYFHNDHLGTSQRLTNDQGVLTWSARMEAFGKTTTIDSIITNLVNGQSQTILMPTTTVNNFRFAGQIEDGETGTFYNWNRDYDSAIGRYVQSDPIGLMGGLNRYGYVGGNPIGRVDPSGLLLGGLLNAGECFGDSAAQYWADKQVSTGNWLYAIPGSLAALWTPSTSDATLGTLAAGYGAVGIARSAANFSEWLSNPILYEFGQKTLTDSAFSVIAGLSAAERGAAIVNGGLGKAIFNLWGNWAKTWGTGPTPAASLFLLVAGGAEAVAGGNKGFSCQ